MTGFQITTLHGHHRLAGQLQITRSWSPDTTAARKAVIRQLGMQAGAAALSLLVLTLLLLQMGAQVG